MTSTNNERSDSTELSGTALGLQAQAEQALAQRAFCRHRCARNER